MFPNTNKDWMGVKPMTALLDVIIKLMQFITFWFVSFFLKLQTTESWGCLPLLWGRLPLCWTSITLCHCSAKLEREQLQRKSFLHVPSQELYEYNKVRAVRLGLLLYSERPNMYMFLTHFLRGEEGILK